MDSDFLTLDFPALLTAILAGVTCGLTGSFLILRKQAMLSDALSHAVLPGLAIGFIISGTMNTMPMITGALCACLLAVFLVHILEKYVHIDSGSAMGAVFTNMFALGLVLLSTKIGSRVHLDAHHALHGALELIYWPTPKTWDTLPHSIKILAGTCALTLSFIVLFFRDLTLSSFDPIFAQTTGVKSRLINITLATLTALSAVACFEAVGSVLVIALFVCPAACGYLLARRVSALLSYSTLYAILSVIIGYTLSIALPKLIGLGHTLNAGGMIALTAGALVWLTILIRPHNT